MDSAASEQKGHMGPDVGTATDVEERVMLLCCAGVTYVI